jgi:hypothetical protein
VPTVRVTGLPYFFLVHLTKTGKNVPNNQNIYQICSHDIYQMDIKYIYPPKFTQSVIFCLKIYHLATMVCDFWCLLHLLCLCFCVKCVSPLKICPPSRILAYWTTASYGRFLKIIEGAHISGLFLSTKSFLVYILGYLFTT